MNPANLSSSRVPDDLVSVIIPAYNTSSFLKETLDSVFAQTYPHYEVIVVNDGSSDTSALEELLLNYAHRVTYVRQDNAGPSSARNTGLRLAKGNLVACLDSDDIWDPEYLQIQTKFLREHSEYDLVYCNAQFFGDPFYEGREYMDILPSNGEATSVAIISRRCHVFTSVMARTEALSSVGFDESIHASEDFDCWVRFTAAGYRIGYHRRILVRYRKHAGSASANRQRMAEYNIKVLTKALALWPGDSEEVQALLRAKEQRSAELERIKGQIALDNHKISEAIGHFRKTNSYYKSLKTSAAIVLMRFVPTLVIGAYKLRSSLHRGRRGAWRTTRER